MSKWREIRCDFFNEEEEKYYVDAWKTGNDNEEGKVIDDILVQSLKAILSIVVIFLFNSTFDKEEQP